MKSFNNKINTHTSVKNVNSKPFTKQPQNTPFKKNDEKSEKSEKTYILSEILKEGACFGCLNKNCKIEGDHGTNIPYQICNFVKNPTYIEDVQKAIKDTDLYFYDKKPFFTVCRYFHTECNNCKDLRIQFVDYNGKSFGVCCAKPNPNSNSITVGVHIDLKLVINDNKYRVMAIPIEINYEKLVEDYENKQKLINEFNENNINSNNNLTKLMNINVNIVKNDDKNIVISDDIDSIMNDVNINSNENNINFPSLSPTHNFTRSFTPIDFSKITENVKNEMLNELNELNDEELNEQDIIINNSIDTLLESNKYVEIIELKGQLDKCLKESSILQNTIDDLTLEVNSKKKQLNYLNDENSELNHKKNLVEGKNKELQRKLDDILLAEKDKDLSLILKNYASNVKNINNAVIDALNEEYYANIYHKEINIKSFIEKMY